MKIKDIPIVPLGPGSQPAEQDGTSLDYIDMPKGMATYEAPEMPDPGDVHDLDGAREAMDWLRQAIASYQPGADPLMANITGLDEENRDLVNQILGEGEVSVTYSGVIHAKVQESVLAGIWRTFYLDDDNKVSHDLLEVCDVPYLVRMPSSSITAGENRFTDVEPGRGVMNAMSILTEIDDRCRMYVPGAEAHSINLTLLPLSDEDIEFLEQTLGRGPVYILSRGYGDCHIIGTSVPNVWWVRYFNSMDRMILNSLEVVDVPMVARAAPEDIADSRQRLEELLEPYWRDSD